VRGTASGLADSWGAATDAARRIRIMIRNREPDFFLAICPHGSVG